MKKNGVILLILIAFLIILVIFPKSCDYTGGWGIGNSKSCKCIGTKITLQDNLAVDGAYHTACVGIILPREQ